MDLTKRRLLINAGCGAAALGAAALWGLPMRRAVAAAAGASFEVHYTDEEWKKRLSANEYAILRKEGTETPFTSPLNDEHRNGRFACAGCGLDAFSSKTKFDSGTGWPSFWQPLPNAVGENRDSTLGMVRTEVHCRRCGGHLGHVFDDGPKPTGLRYCMNGFAMHFTPVSA
jgi:peptide-methionine (R)-S-oxide reductase